MTFGEPTLLLIGIIAVPLLIAFIIWAEQRRKHSMSLIGDEQLIKRLSAGVNWRGRQAKNVLLVIAFALLMIASARPQWGEIDQTIEQQGVQVMVALDVSKSMLAQDVLPDRLTRAKMEIEDLMVRLDGDELGLVVFSGASFIQFPLTSDYNTALSFLGNADPDIISRPGTAIGDAIRTGLRGFDENSPAQKVIVIMTDGEDGETNPIAAAQEAADQGVVIYTIGFGSTDGEPIPEYDARGNMTGYKTDSNGETVLSKLDDTTLREIAEIGGGRYYKATAAGTELDALAAELNLLQQGAINDRETVIRIEHFQFFLALALVGFVLIELIPERVREVAQDSTKRVLSRFVRAEA